MSPKQLTVVVIDIGYARYKGPGGRDQRAQFEQRNQARGARQKHVAGGVLTDVAARKQPDGEGKDASRPRRAAVERALRPGGAGACV